MINIYKYFIIERNREMSRGGNHRIQQKHPTSPNPKRQLFYLNLLGLIMSRNVQNQKGPQLSKPEPTLKRRYKKPHQIHLRTL